MKTALLYRDNEEKIEVSAEEVKAGIYNRYEEFIDPEYEFKVEFVKGARNNGGPYFRLYYSLEEYKKRYPERASRYEILANMRRFDETAWHKNWKEKFSEFCVIEKCIKNHITQKRRFADAFYEKTKTCIEFQHSYINFDFEERNEFYSNLSINIIWLYDLPHANTCLDKEGNIEILEDNARGFFRISEKPDNLKNHYVYIQVKSKKIYRVQELLRRDSSTHQKSTIRYFIPTEIYTEAEFINAIKTNTIGILSNNCSRKANEKPQTLKNLWNAKYSWMKVKNVENGDIIRINRNSQNEMFRDYSTGCIRYIYVDDKYGEQSLEKKKEYQLSQQNENRPIWILIRAKNKQCTS